MDGDGKTEWLVWLSPGIDPIFFYPDGDAYRLSRYEGYQSPTHRSADLRQPDGENRYYFITLPDDAGKALVNMDVGDDHFGWLQCGACGGGPTYTCSREYYEDSARRPGDVTIWRVEDGMMTPLFYNLYCGGGEIESLFPNNTSELHAVGSAYEANIDTAVLSPATFAWDSHNLTYMPPLRATRTPIIDNSSFAQTQTPPEFPYRTIDEALIAGDIPTVLEMADYRLSSMTDNNVSYRYYRALALELLDRPDEALAEYLTIYEDAPESAWGTLAALHFEAAN
jgi:hypothetical protein